MSRYRLARRARADLDRIWLRIAQAGGIKAADGFTDRITARFPVLARMPEIGRTIDVVEPGLRMFPVGDYLIYYRKAPRGGILISRIIHGMRDQGQAWSRTE